MYDANRDGILEGILDDLWSGVTTSRCHASAVHVNLAAKPEITQTDYNHGCCFADKGSNLPRIRDVFTADFNVWVWKNTTWG